MQIVLLLGYSSLLAAALLVGWRWPRLRPLAFAVGIVSGPHAVFYLLFLWLPDVLGGRETMLFSLMLRYEVLGIAALVLGMAVLRERGRGRWK